MKVSKRTVFTMELEEQEWSDLKWLLNWIYEYGPKEQGPIEEDSAVHRAASQLLKSL